MEYFRSVFLRKRYSVNGGLIIFILTGPYYHYSNVYMEHFHFQLVCMGKALELRHFATKVFKRALTLRPLTFGFKRDREKVNKVSVLGLRKLSYKKNQACSHGVA